MDEVHISLLALAVVAERDALRALVTELVGALDGLMPFMHEDGMPGETEYERAVLVCEVALAAARAQGFEP